MRRDMAIKWIDSIEIPHISEILIFRMDSNPFAQLAKKSKCEAPVELHNVVQAVFKITMDMEDQKEVVVLPNLMGQG